MRDPRSRRNFLMLTGSAILGACAKTHGPAASSPMAVGTGPFASIERHLGGRVGVFALESGTERYLAYRQDERFAMCSTFKWVLVAAVLARVDRGELSLGQSISYGERDILANSPVTSAQVGKGEISLETLAEGAVTRSDNTAANLLLAQVGGPSGLTRFLRDIGDDVTRLDRNEPTLGTNLAGDVRDTTTPRAMAMTLRRVLTGNVLALGSRDRLVHWLVECQTGLTRLRAGLPPGWRAGDKTGTGDNGACNDVAVLWPPSASPWFVASYLSGSSASASELYAAHAEIGRIVASGSRG